MCFNFVLFHTLSRSTVCFIRLISSSKSDVVVNYVLSLILAIVSIGSVISLIMCMYQSYIHVYVFNILVMLCVISKIIISRIIHICSLYYTRHGINLHSKVHASIF